MRNVAVEAVRTAPQRTMEVTAAERIVLIATKRFKPSYAGRDRFQMAREEATEGRAWITGHIPGERFITRAEWATARQSLIAKGLLTQIGGITMAGRAVLGDDA